MSVPNPTYLNQIRARVAEHGRLGQTDCIVLLAELDRLSGERDEAWLEVMERRTQLQELHHYVSELKQQAQDHPSEVARLTAECEEWATRCGAAELERDADAEEASGLSAALAELTAERDDLRAELESLTDTDLLRRMGAYTAGQRSAAGTGGA